MINESEIVPYHTAGVPSERGPWLVFAPHADDETFGMGGTIALATAQGIAVDLVVVTDGALGGSGDAQALVNTRQQEARAAAQVLGIREVHFLGQADRGLENTPALQEQVAKLIVASGCKTVYFPGPFELHPDHRACALLVWDSIKRCKLPELAVVSYEISVQNSINTLVDITSVLAIKDQALAVYLSQLGENNYLDVVHGLNTLRTLTLPATVLAAEGFYCFSEAECQLDLQAWLAQWTRRLLE